ncbi:hypothetical protein [Micromonospora sp. NPDC000442]|uniref:hypothetical protein n=1 Tax=Micromonospora sp. NPDC000442 TaxID=3364217 RepID=UPI0036D032C9
MPVGLLDSQAATLESLCPEERGLVLDLRLSTDELITATVDQFGLPRHPTPSHP